METATDQLTVTRRREIHDCGRRTRVCPNDASWCIEKTDGPFTVAYWACNDHLGQMVTQLSHTLSETD